MLYFSQIFSPSLLTSLFFTKNLFDFFGKFELFVAFARLLYIFQYCECFTTTYCKIHYWRKRIDKWGIITGYFWVFIKNQITFSSVFKSTQYLVADHQTRTRIIHTINKNTIYDIAQWFDAEQCVVTELDNLCFEK